MEFDGTAFEDHNSVIKLYLRLRHYANNSLWILVEKGGVLGLTLLSSVIVARYLGPEQYGLLSYVFALVGILGIAGHMGLAGLVVREAVQDPKRIDSLLATSASLKFLGMFIGYITLVMINALMDKGVSTTLVAVAGLSLLARPLDVMDFYFQSRLESRYASLSRLTSLVVTTAFRIALVVGGYGLIYFAWAHTLQATVSGVVLLAVFLRQRPQSPRHWSFDPKLASRLLRGGSLVFIGSIFATIYLKIDQIMLMWLTSEQAVGEYVVAAQLSEVWYVVPTAIVASFFPRLIQLRDQNPAGYTSRLQKLFDGLFLLAFVVALAVSVLAGFMVSSLYGDDFLASAEILRIHIWAAIFIFMRAAVSRWILIENLLYLSVLTQGAGAVVNVLLNLWLIPDHGGVGAAYATLIAYAIATMPMLLVSVRARPIFFMMIRAIFTPIRYPFFAVRHSS